MNNYIDYDCFYNEFGGSLYVQFHKPFGSYLKETHSDFKIAHDDVTHYVVGVYIPSLKDFDFRCARGHLEVVQYRHLVESVIRTKKELNRRKIFA